MKKILRNWFINLIALRILAEIIVSVEFGEGLKTLALATLVLTLFELFVKPLLKFLLLPINLLTLGLLRWIVNVIGLYTASFLVTSFTISPYYFPGITRGELVIPPVQLSPLLSYIIASFCLDILLITIRHLLRK